MNEPEELTRFLAELKLALASRGRYRREIMDEIRAHLLDAIAARGGEPNAARTAIRNLGTPHAVAAGFNRLRMQRMIRRAWAAAAVMAASSVGGVALLTSLDRAESRAIPLNAQGRPPASSGAFRIVVVDPKTGRVMRIGRSR